MIIPVYIDVTLKILERFEGEQKPLDRLMHHYFRDHKKHGSRDRREISSLIYSICRHWLQLEWWIKKYSMPVTIKSKVIVYLKLDQKFSTRQIKRLFEHPLFEKKRIEAHEEFLLQSLDGKDLSDSEQPSWVRYNMPEWIALKLEKRFKSNFENELKALSEEAFVDLRVNTIKSSREDVYKALQKEGHDVSKMLYSPLGLRVQKRWAIGNSSLFQKGHIEVQDEGSQLISFFSQVKAGERVVDFCAGAGGKTLALSAQMENKGHIVALDTSSQRLKRLRTRLKRASVNNVEIRTLNTEKDPWVKKHKGKYDCVLIDAPCSGVGTFRRNPDHKWRLSETDLNELVTLQQSILKSASRLVKKGGRLIYATCSLLEEENEQQAKAFLSDHTDFTGQPLKELASNYAIDMIDQKAYDMILTPCKYKTDGFYIAVFNRIK